MWRPRFLLASALLLLAGCSAPTIALPSGGSVPTLTLSPPSPEAYESQAALAAAVVPPRDLVDLTRRFGPPQELADVAQIEPTPYQVGDVVSFWTKNHDTGVNELIDAELVYRSAELNLWFQETERPRAANVSEAARVIEQRILPLTRTLMGEEWRPGIDGDPRINLLHTTNLGAGVIGYYSSADEFVSAVNPFSNQRELLYINLRNAPLNSDGYFEVVAHEMSHMIHWHHDANEAAWVEEGLAELSAHVNGYNSVVFEESFALNPDVQLTNFTEANGELSNHYGASFLFLTYFRDRFGDAALKALVDRPENGRAGFDAVLRDLDQGDFDGLFADWVAANYLAGRDAALVPDQYAALKIPPMALAKTIEGPSSGGLGDVNQYGVDYIGFQHAEPLTLVFTGTQQIDLLPLEPHSGDYVWSAYPADNADMTLTGRFDLSNVDKATLTFWSWYEIEAGWDYAYVVVSTDEGRTWSPLETIYTTQANPQGNLYGPGLTGFSGSGDEPAWVKQIADLTPYASREILVRFEYVTDQSQHGAGFVLDDIEVPELGFLDDIENGNSIWEAAGFVRHANRLPQSWLVQFVVIDEDGASVQRLGLDDQMRGRWTLPLGPSVEAAVLAISATAPVTTLPAAYEWQVIPVE